MLHVNWPLNAAVSSIMLLTSALPVLPQAVGQAAPSEARHGQIGTEDATWKAVKLPLEDDDGKDDIDAQEFESDEV